MKKHIVIGFLLSIFTTIAGCYIYMEYIMQNGFDASWEWMIDTHNQSSILSLGAIPNLLLFFVFLKRKEDFKARGVLFGVILIALFVLGFKFF